MATESWLAGTPAGGLELDQTMVNFIRCKVTLTSCHIFLPIFQAHLSWGTKINLQMCSGY